MSDSLNFTTQKLFKHIQHGDKLQSIHNPFERSYVHELLVKRDKQVQYFRVPIEIINELLSQRKIRRTECHKWVGAVDYHYHLMIVRDSSELLEFLKNGAVLTTRWRYGKRINTLSLPNGENLKVQLSNIQALQKSKSIYSILLSGDNYDYYLVNNQ